jgi:hypothetical protein
MLLDVNLFNFNFERSAGIVILELITLYMPNDPDTEFNNPKSQLKVIDKSEKFDQFKPLLEKYFKIIYSESCVLEA